MKHPSDIQAELNEITDLLTNKELIELRSINKATQTKMKNKIPLLRLCLNYLKSNPTEEFIEKEIDRIENKISLRMMLFDESKFEALAKPVVAKLRKEHEQLHEIKKLRNQVRTLRYLVKPAEIDRG